MSNKSKKNITSTLLGLFLVAIVALWAVAVVAKPITKSAADLAAASQVVFGPKDGVLIVKAAYVVAGAGGDLAFLSRSGSKLAPTANSTNGAQVVAIVNTAHVMSTNDWIVYVHADGTMDTAQATASSLTSVTLGSGISSAGASGDFLYEVVTNGVIPLTAATAFNQDGPVMFATPNDSPLVIQTTSGTTNSLLITVDDQ